mgnify:CR=1 FL=1
MEGIIYITIEQAKVIHAKTIEYSGGGTYEHFDLGRLESVLQNIQNDDYYPTFSNKLTCLVFNFCAGHLVNDGCKRIAFFSAPSNMEISKNRENGYTDALSS